MLDRSRLLPMLLLIGALPLAAAARPASLPFRDGERLLEATPQGVMSAGRLQVQVRDVRSGLTWPAEAGREVIVRLDPGTGEEALRAAGLRLGRPLLPAAGLWLAEGEGDALETSARFAGVRAPGIAYVTPDLAYRMKPLAGRDTPPNDPRFGGQWYLDRIGILDAWALETGSPDTSIVVVDTGCDLTHPDLASKFDPGLDVADGDDDPSFVSGEPGASHGTNVAGLIAAATDNGEGIAGTCPECRMRCVRLLVDRALPISASVAAFQFALDTGAAVVSNSWGYSERIAVPQALADAIAAVATQGRGGLGALVIFAVGNDDRELGAEELLALPGVIGVGAVSRYDEATSFTNWGPWVDLVAPVGTVTTDLQGPEGSEGDYTHNFGGTSSACPVAAGVAGLLVSAAPEMSGAALEQILLETTRPAYFATPDETGHDVLYGYGIIDPRAALERALGITPGEDGGTPGLDGGTVQADAGLGGGGGEVGCGCASGGGGTALLGALALLGLLLGTTRGGR